jgi:hypothetical protein
LTSDASRIDDAEEVFGDVTDGYGMMFVRLLAMMVIDICKV